MFRLRLVALSGTKFDDEVDEVLLPTMAGQIGVMTGHMPLVSVATGGIISIRRQPRDPEHAREYLAIRGGVVEVYNIK